MDKFVNTEELKDELKKVWIQIVEDLKSDKDFNELAEVMKWVETVMNSNVPFGKQTRAITIVEIYRRMTKERTAAMDFRACVMGWVAEIGHTAALIADDIMDGSLTRRGKPTWYLRSDVGMSAINDVLILENLTWRMIRKYFYGTVFYEKLLFISQDTMLLTIFGQSLDTRLSIHPDISKFSHSNYNNIVKYKTSIYSFYAPVAIGLILVRAESDDTNVLDDAKKVLLDIGRLFQIQDDYLDLYGNTEVTGKIGTDIMDGKCSWLIVEALERATIEQISILQESYGTKKIEDVNKVEEIYEALNMSSVFEEFEKKTYKQISKVIDTFEPESLREPFNALLYAIYKRKK